MHEAVVLEFEERTRHQMTMRSIRRALSSGGIIAATGLFIAQPLTAQEIQVPPSPAAAAPAENADTVVVTAPRPQDRTKVRALALSITPNASFEEPMARFTGPVCFSVLGLPRPYLRPFTERLIKNARRAGVRLGGARCKPNALVMFVKDGRTEFAEVLRREPWLLRDLRPAEVRRLSNEQGPVRGWTTSELRGRDGERIDAAFGTPPSLKLLSASRLTLPVRRDLFTSVVLIDIGATEGRTTVQLADYAQMRTLAATRPASVPDGGTILTLFHHGAATPPAEMTCFDRGYLKALYAGPGDYSAMAIVAHIARRVADGCRHPDALRRRQRHPARASARRRTPERFRKVT